MLYQGGETLDWWLIGQHYLSQPTRGVESLLFQCWPTVCDAGPTLKQQWFNASCWDLSSTLVRLQFPRGQKLSLPRRKTLIRIIWRIWEILRDKQGNVDHATSQVKLTNTHWHAALSSQFQHGWMTSYRRCLAGGWIEIQFHWNWWHINLYTLNNISSLEGTFEYYYHATPGEPLQFQVTGNSNWIAHVF